MMENLERRVVKIIAQISDHSSSNITDNTSFDELELTSLDAVTIAYELEQEFNIRLPDTKVYSIRTVNELIEGVRLLVRHKSEA